jgi:AraC family transcriptional regulator
MFELTVPEANWAVFPGKGSNEDIQKLQVRIVSEWLPTSCYEWANAPDIEVYLNDDPANMRFEVWIPMLKK